MPSFYVIVTTLLLISLALLGFAETFSDVRVVYADDDVGHDRRL